MAQSFDDCFSQNEWYPLSESKSYSEAKIVALFEKYKDDSEDFILSEGIEEFCIDLQLKPDEFKVLGEKEYHFYKQFMIKSQIIRT